MPLEAVATIDDLVATNPIDDDPVDEGDNHIRNVKVALTKNVSGNATSTQLKASDVTVVNADNKGLQVTGQVTASDAAPVNPEELTRKDYVDGLIAALQLELDNLINGTTKFTGAQEAPDFTAV